MKNCFIAVRRVRDSKGVKDANGNLPLVKASEEKEDEGTFYYEAHPHPSLKDREFVNVNEAIQAVRDFQLTNQDGEVLKQAGVLAKAGQVEAALALLSNTNQPKIGEVIFLNVIEF